MTIRQPDTDVERAFSTLFEEADFVRPAELHYDDDLSDRFDADVFLLSELNQVTGAYKIRGAFNWFSCHQSSSVTEVVAFSAGNHAAAVAACASLFDTKARIFMPENTPGCKVDLVRRLGGMSVTPVLKGKNVDEAAEAGRNYLTTTGNTTGFIHPFDDPAVVAAQGTLGVELEQMVPHADVIVAPVGGGGLLSGLIKAAKHTDLHYVAVEPEGAPSLTNGLVNPGSSLTSIDTFVDGAAVKKVGQSILDSLDSIPDRYSVVMTSNYALRRCVTDFWTRDHGLKPELAGALSVAALENIRSFITNKTVVCVVSGGNLSEQRFRRDVLVN